MKKIVQKIVWITIWVIIYIMINEIKVQAASASLSATTKETTEGQEVTVTANVSAGAWNLKLSGANKSETVYGYTNSNSNASDSKSITFTAGSAGTTYTFTLTGDMTDISATKSEPVNKSISITVKAKESSNSGDNTNSGNTGSTTKSSEARLNTFGITPKEYDFSGFSKNRSKEEWSTTVPNSVKEVTVYATPLGKNAKVEGTGKITLKEGNNTAKVKVTAEDGTTKTYTLTIRRKTVEEETSENDEARLKNLGIKPEEYDFTGFESEKTEYSVEVPNEVNEVEVYATPMNSKAQITGTGKVELKEGKNELKVEVTSINGTKKTYTIVVTRKESENSNLSVEEFGLKTLSIEGLNLKPNFKTGIYEYTVELTEDLSSIEIQAQANNEKATVEIIGNENLQQGENIITILVQNPETNENATYQIIVNKNVVQEDIIAKTSWLKPETWGKEEKIKMAIILVLIILINCLIAIKIKLSQSSKKMDLPGAEELDKAIAEHQELSEEPDYNDNINIEQNYIEDISKNRFGEINEETEGKTRKRGKHF